MRASPNVSVLLAEARAIDRGARAVRSTAGDVSFDYLVLATGVEPFYFGHDGWRPHAPGLKTVGDAVRIRERVLAAFERAENEADPARRSALLTFVVVGGGPTGVELAGAIAELARHALRRDFRRIDPRAAQVVLVEAAPAILPSFPEPLRQSARADLGRLGVEVLLGTSVAEIRQGAVVVGSRVLDAATVLWAAGNRASPLAAGLDAPLDRMGRVIVRPDLSIEGDPRIFAIGDIAHLAAEGGVPLPGLAPVAIQMGRHVARQIRADLGRRPRRPFRYRDKGQLATVGRSRAVASLGRFAFSGFLAWLLWGFVHILYLIGFENRAVVMTRWLVSYVTFGRGARVLQGLAGGEGEGA